MSAADEECDDDGDDVGVDGESDDSLFSIQTDAMKKMEAKFKDQNEQRENLSRLLTVIKDKDPALLRTLHKSIVTR